MNEKKIKKEREIKELKKKEITKYIITYALIITGLISIYLLFQENLAFLNNLTAGALSLLLNIFGINSTHDSTAVMASGFSVNIIDECTGIYEILVYTACVLAYPTSTNKKLAGIAMGTPLLLTINMVRLLFLVFIGIWHADLFDFFHYIIWQITLIVFVALVLLLWIFKVVKK